KRRRGIPCRAAPQPARTGSGVGASNVRRHRGHPGRRRDAQEDEPQSAPSSKWSRFNQSVLLSPAKDRNLEKCHSAHLEVRLLSLHLSDRSERRIYVFGQLKYGKGLQNLARNSEQPSLTTSLPLLDLTGECHLTYSPRTPARAPRLCSGQASTARAGDLALLHGNGDPDRYVRQTRSAHAGPRARTAGLRAAAG